MIARQKPQLHGRGYFKKGVPVRARPRIRKQKAEERPQMNAEKAPIRYKTEEELTTERVPACGARDTEKTREKESLSELSSSVLSPVLFGFLDMVQSRVTLGLARMNRKTLGDIGLLQTIAG
jgi:hypothetical protein